jgi:uncharacterized membrane protein (DUF4010 family)
MNPAESSWVAWAVALGCGLLIGLERERRKGEGPDRAPAGIRSFTVASIAGALAESLGEPGIGAIGALLVAALALVGQYRRAGHDPGITSALALFVTYLLGATAMRQPALAGALAVVLAGLLAARSRLHRFSTHELTEAELRDGLILAGAALVVLPLMPERGPAWLPGIEPRALWRLVVILLALQAAGYIALRVLGARIGLLLGGIASGFVSSTATFAAMGARARAEPALASPCAAGALASNLATMAQLAFVMAAIAPPMLAMLAPALMAGAVATLIAVLPGARRPLERSAAPVAARRAFDLPRSIGFAAMLAAITSLLAWSADRLGAGAATAGAALAGFVDVHAAAASLGTLVERGAMSGETAGQALLLALGANSLSKGIAAAVAGGPRFAARVVPGLVALPAAAWTATWWAGLAG